MAKKSQEKKYTLSNQRYFGTCTDCNITYEISVPFTYCFECGSSIAVTDSETISNCKESSFSNQKKAT